MNLTRQSVKKYTQNAKLDIPCPLRYFPDLSRHPTDDLFRDAQLLFPDYVRSDELNQNGFQGLSRSTVDIS